MKFTNPLIASALFLASQAAAQCRVFNFHVANSAGPDLNGLVLQNYNGDAVVNAAPAPTVEAFWDDVAPVELMANGIDGDGADNFMLVPYGTNGIEQLVFADFAVAEARFSDWAITDGLLTYGDVADRFYAFPYGAVEGAYTIRWVPAGLITTTDSFPVDLQLVCP
ncbi:uncharacterized protein H6S33_007617 [Morchella sextelata]|uniref:uncharacterized protein n=1 Tax=Morchella sextelata TaxID=1174677 RepID=UPI001D03D1DD|nr:uncharacterized protein H6S33_007617 [Morchella sextelata]KAH0603295.1 hypothetical protein H6S33_007617 [Morchella sextelata]